MNYINKRANKIAKACFDEKNRMYQVAGEFHLFPAWIIENSKDWEKDDKVWRTMDGRRIPFSEITHQHWSNIYYYFQRSCGSYSNRYMELALTQLRLRFNGILLPRQPYFEFEKKQNDMKPIEFITSYLQTEATVEEKMRVREIVTPKPFVTPPIRPEVVVQSLTTACNRMWIMSGRTQKLQVVKYVKDVTGWGLKDSKDWADANIFVN